MRTIAPEDARKVLHRDGSLEDTHVSGRLVMGSVVRGKDMIRFPVSFVNCVFDELDSSVVWYDARVVWNQCVFRRIHLTCGVYFLRGLECRDSEFLSEVMFDSGGHNGKDAPIIFERVRFHKFVDFFDSRFNGPVVFRDVEFLEGTNLLNAEKGWVTFDVPPVLERVVGAVDLSLNLEGKEGHYSLDTIGPRERGRQEAEALRASSKI